MGICLALQGIQLSLARSSHFWDPTYFYGAQSIKVLTYMLRETEREKEGEEIVI